MRPLLGRRNSLQFLALLTLCIMALASAALAQGQCIESNNQDDPTPTGHMGSHCKASLVHAPFTSPIITSAFPSAQSDVPPGDIMYQGYPFCVSGEDYDEDVVLCKQQGSGNEKRLVRRDSLAYKWHLEHFAPGGLLDGGYLDGGLQSGTQNIATSAVVLRLPRGLPSGTYRVDVVCRWWDKGRAYADMDQDQPGELRWRCTIASSGCSATMANLVPPVLISGWNQPTTPNYDPCCITGASYLRWKKPIALWTDVHGMVEAGRYYVETCRYEDEDLIRMDCEDKPDSGCPESSLTGTDYEPIMDHISVNWNQIAGAPGAIVLPGHQEAETLLIAQPTDAIELCVSMLTWAGPDAAEIRRFIITPVSLPLLMIGRGPMVDTGDVLLIPDCSPVSLYVNDDDDNRDGRPDNTVDLPVAAEDDMYELSIIPQLPNPPASLEVQLRVGGQVNLEVYKAANHSSRWLPNEWLPLPVEGVSAWLDGLRSSATFGGTRIEIRMRVGANGPMLTSIIDATVYGITSVTFRDDENNGGAAVGTWSQLPLDLRPPGFEDNQGVDSPGEHYFCDPGVMPHVDDPTALTSGTDLWGLSRRNCVQVRVAVGPASPVPVRFWVSSRDVDDISYALHGSSGEVRRDFMDPGDRAPAPAGFTDGIRRDNNDGVIIGGVVSLDGAFQEGGSLVRVVEKYDRPGVHDLTFVVSMAPCDNYRVIASLGSYMDGNHGRRGVLHEAAAKVIVSVPADFDIPSTQNNESYSIESERRAAVVYRRVDGASRQSVAVANPASESELPLVIPDASPAGHQTAVSKTLTIRRRLWIEELRVGDPPETWNLTTDPGLENRAGPITRFVIEALDLPQHVGHREWVLGGGTDGAFGRAGVSEVNLPLMRNCRELPFNTIADQQVWPWLAQVPFIFYWQQDTSHCWRYWAIGPDPGPRPVLWPQTFSEQKLLGLLPTAMMPGQPRSEWLGPFEGGIVRSNVEDLAEVHANSNQSLWVYGLPGSGAPCVQLEWQAPGGQWQVLDVTLMTKDESTNRVTLVPSNAGALPMAVGARIRARASAVPPGWNQECEVVASTTSEIVVAPDASGTSLRVPVRVYDDTALQARAQGDGAAWQDALTVMVARNGRPPVNYLQYLYREVGVAPTALGGAFAIERVWKKSIPIDMYHNGAYNAHLCTIGTQLEDSRLHRETRWANDRCWAMTVSYCPDQLMLMDNDPNGFAGSWAFSGRDKVRIILPAAKYGLAGLPFVMVAPWSGRDGVGWMVPIGAYARHGLTSGSTLEVYRAQMLAHEIGHCLLPDEVGLLLPLSAADVLPNDPANAACMHWDIYQGILEQGNGENDLQSTGNYDGHHGIPGIMAYKDIVDPVSSPSALVSCINSCFQPAGSKGESVLSPFAVRWIKERSKGPRNFNENRDW